MKQKIIKILFDLFHVVVGNGLARVWTMLSSVIIARSLGVTVFGKFSLFYICLILTWQLPQGFDTTYIRFARSHPQQSEKNEYLAAAILGKSIYIFLVLLASIVGLFFYSGSREELESLAFVVKGVVAGCALSFNGSLAAIFQEKEQFNRYSLMNNFTNGSFLVGLLILWFIPSGLTLDRVIIVYISIALMIGIGSLIALRKINGTLLVGAKRKFIMVFDFGKWTFGVTIAYYLFQRLDVLILAQKVSYADLGFYSAAAQIAMVVSLFTGSVGAVFMPKAMTAVKSRANLRAYIQETILPIAAVLSGILILLLGGGFFITLIFGKQFLQSVVILRILLAGWCFSAVYIPFSYMFYGLDAPKTRLILEMVKVIIAFSFLYLLVPWGGAVGAAWAMTLSLVLEAFISGGVLFRKLQMKFNHLIII